MAPDEPDLRPGGRRFAALVAGVAAAALVLRYVVLVVGTRDTLGPLRATARYFSEFSVLSGGLVALTAGLAATASQRPLARLLARPAARAGVGLYSVVTGGAYFLVLRHLWRPRGLQWWAEAGLHYAVPIFYLVWWTCSLGHGQLQRRHVLLWLLVPLAHLVWTIALGVQAGECPYPFLDVGALGVAAVARNALLVLGVFAAGGLAALRVDRAFARREGPIRPRVAASR
ncbi:Pr6Pr family membrane protein [Nannocystis bainbridge]|uniref:Pr6Pr family membrane protein n=1 Tax=Nannocystis bainbridge TaxID=2995303 RepID=A0ABT5E345_9BACT|nr:Pr6Pr family membrane protein [Nannocystis bainbridge]MDC0720292.1 Pr6Pr family membrane protein [Nannocystis bainbridge]